MTPPLAEFYQRASLLCGVDPPTVIFEPELGGGDCPVRERQRSDLLYQLMRCDKSPDKQGFVVAVGRRFLRKTLKVIEESEVWLACQTIGHHSFKPYVAAHGGMYHALSAVEPIPKYRQYHRPIVHLLDLCL